MFNSLLKYKHTGVFSFSPTERLQDKCNAPKTCSGVYMVEQGEELIHWTQWKNACRWYNMPSQRWYLRQTGQWTSVCEESKEAYLAIKDEGGRSS